MISKKKLKILKNFILIYFQLKNILKNTLYYNFKYSRSKASKILILKVIGKKNINIIRRKVSWSSSSLGIFFTLLSFFKKLQFTF
jgi:hypothetical protein